MRGDDAVDDAEPLGLACAEAIAQERELHCLLRAYRARQEPRRGAVGTGADTAIGHGEDAVGSSHREVGGKHEAQPEAARGAVDLGDDRLRHPPHAPNDRVDAVDRHLEMPPALIRRPIEQAIEGAQVAARHEVAAGALQHQDAGLGLSLDLCEGGDQGFAKLVVERVQHIRPVEGHPGDAVCSLDQNGVAHVACLPLVLLPPRGAS